LSLAAGSVAAVPTSRESILAFRQRRQHLDRRLPPARLAEVAAACCGLRTSALGYGRQSPPRARSSPTVLVAAWRARRRGGTLEVDLAPFDGLPPPVLAAGEQEAARLAPLRSCTAATATAG
jgi:hypothetical protein